MTTCSMCNDAGCPLCDRPRGVFGQVMQRLRWRWWSVLTWARLLSPAHRRAVFKLWCDDESLHNARHWSRVHVKRCLVCCGDNALCSACDGSGLHVSDHRQTIAFPTFAGHYNGVTRGGNMTAAQAELVWTNNRRT